MSYKHTPGPWETCYWLDDEFSVAQDSPAFTRVCVMSYVVKKGNAPNEEMDANARLIAAAPELLEALQSLIAVEPTASGCKAFELMVTGKDMDRARAAIAKATGGGE